MDCVCCTMRNSTQHLTHAFGSQPGGALFSTLVVVVMVVWCGRLKAGADPNLMDETGAKPGDVFHDGVSMSQRFEIKKLIRQRYNLMGESWATEAVGETEGWCCRGLSCAVSFFFFFCPRTGVLRVPPTRRDTNTDHM